MVAAGGSRDPRIGTVLKDKWKVDARLGRGGVATVYAATHRNGARVAIKVLNREVARNADIRSRFLREGYAANSVNHPGVVRVLDDDTTEEGQPFLVMDLLEGELCDERRMRKGGRLPLLEVLRIGDQILDVLAAAHEKGIIHRDIKPENIFLTKSGAVRVLDFGIARMRLETGGEMTATGVLLGTPEFMSPEQANGVPGDIDRLTDIWSVGATMFTLLSGESVHGAADTTSAILATLSQPARSLASVVPETPRPVVDVIDKALFYEKRARWQDARAMQQALASAARGLTSASSSYETVPRPRTTERPPPPSHRSSEEPTVANEPFPRSTSGSKRPAAPEGGRKTTAEGPARRSAGEGRKVSPPEGSPRAEAPSRKSLPPIEGPRKSSPPEGRKLSEPLPKPKPPLPPRVATEEEATTVAERQAPVSLPKFGDVKDASFDEAPTRVAARPPLEPPPPPSSPNLRSMPMPTPAIINADAHTIPLATPSPQPDGRMMHRMPSAPPPPRSDANMGGFILRPPPSTGEPLVHSTPSGPLPPRPRRWTGILVLGAVIAAFLWLAVVIVLRVAFR